MSFKNLSWLAIKYSRITIAFWIGIAVIGAIAFSSLKYGLFPDVTFPVAIIRAESSNLSVLETEMRLTNPIEKALEDIRGLTDIESTTYPQQTVINLLFDPGTDIKTITEKLNKILNEVSFPDDTSWDIIPLNLNESAAVTYAITSNNKSLLELVTIAQEKIIPNLQNISGVSKIKLLGNGDTKVRFNNKDAISLQIIKTSDANTLELVKTIDREISKLQQQLKDINLTIAETQAEYIKQATQATIEALWGAIILSILTILIFLRNWRATLITAIAIPGSLLGTFIVMKLAGFNLETLTLLALALVIGIIVDDAIVEVENIIRYLEEGNSPYKSALLATKEIGFTVSISTLTIVAVFLPIALMGGTLGKFFRPFGLTISVAVLTSLLVARTLSPVLAIYFLKPLKKKNNSSKTKENIIINSYTRLLSLSLSHRKTVISIAIIISLIGVSLIPLIPQGFIPQLDRGEFNIFYTTPLPKNIVRKFNSKDRSTSQKSDPTPSKFEWLKQLTSSPEKILLNKTIRIGKQIEDTITNIPEVETVYNLVGIRQQPHKGKIYLQLKPDRKLTTQEIQTLIRNRLQKIPNVQITVEDIPFVETGDNTPFKIALVGENLDSLRKTAYLVKQKISTLPGLVETKIVGEDPTIIHLNKQRVIYLTGNLTEDIALGDITQQVENIINPLLLPNITLNIQGDSARATVILKEFGITLTIAIIIMLSILYLPFKRWLEPIAIGLALPLAIVGSMFALLITQSDFGMISLIGLIFLLGLLDKNGILLMDYANQLRKLGQNRTQAIINTGKVRLRPILMTTASTILGMLPIALGFGAGSELRQPMAIAIIGGLIASSILSLIFIPVIYTLLEDF